MTHIAREGDEIVVSAEGLTSAIKDQNRKRHEAAAGVDSHLTVALGDTAEYSVLDRCTSVHQALQYYLEGKLGTSTQFKYMFAERSKQTVRSVGRMIRIGQISNAVKAAVRDTPLANHLNNLSKLSVEMPTEKALELAKHMLEKLENTSKKPAEAVPFDELLEVEDGSVPLECLYSQHTAVTHGGICFLEETTTDAILIWDTELARRLGFKNVRNIRTLAKRHEGSLKDLNERFNLKRGEAIPLTEREALFLTAKCRTKAADELTLRLIDSYMFLKQQFLSKKLLNQAPTDTKALEAIVTRLDNQDTVFFQMGNHLGGLMEYSKQHAEDLLGHRRDTLTGFTTVRDMFIVQEKSGMQISSDASKGLQVSTQSLELLKEQNQLLQQLNHNLVVTGESGDNDVADIKADLKAVREGSKDLTRQVFDLKNLVGRLLADSRVVGGVPVTVMPSKGRTSESAKGIIEDIQKEGFTEITIGDEFVKNVAIAAGFVGDESYGEFYSEGNTKLGVHSYHWGHLPKAVGPLKVALREYGKRIRELTAAKTKHPKKAAADELLPKVVRVGNGTVQSLTLSVLAFEEWKKQRHLQPKTNGHSEVRPD